jgi:hypothetical protein
VTPGLDASGSGPPAQSLAAGASETFSTKAAVYGAPAGGRTVVFKALKSVLVIVRGATGAVYFARPLARDEAFRAPVGVGLVAEVADPSAVLVYIDNRLQPPLAAPNAPIDKLAAAVPPPQDVNPVAAPAPNPAAASQAPVRASAPAPAAAP